MVYFDPVSCEAFKQVQYARLTGMQDRMYGGMYDRFQPARICFQVKTSAIRQRDSGG